MNIIYTCTNIHGFHVTMQEEYCYSVFVSAIDGYNTLKKCHSSYVHWILKVMDYA